MKKVKGKKLGRRILSFILTVVLIIGLMSGNMMTVSAEGTDSAVVYKDGGCVHTIEGNICTVCGLYGYCGAEGANLIWELTLNDDGTTHTLTISGSGEMEAYPDDYAPWYYNHRNSISNVILPEGLTNIGNSAFYECTGITSIIIPESVTQIGDWAFARTSLTNVVLPESVTTIGEGSFQDCESLIGITIPGSVTVIGDQALLGCTNLTSVSIPDSVTAISNKMFMDCESLTGITIPDSVTSIGDYAFYRCENLTGITIPDSVTSIGAGAFSECTSFTGITIPNSVTSIGDYAFSECTGLTGITIPDSVTTIGEDVFYHCENLEAFEVDSNNTAYTSADGVLFTRDEKTLVTFPSGKSNVYTIPEGVTTIGNSAFSGSKITGVEIPAGVTTIGEDAFYRCESLTGITIPGSVTTIGEWAFGYCGNLTGVDISEGVTAIGERAFYSCSNLTSINIPVSVTAIGTFMFYNCTELYVHYFGTEEQWNNVTMGSFALEDVKGIHFVGNSPTWIPDESGTTHSWRCSECNTVLKSGEHSDSDGPTYEICESDSSKHYKIYDCCTVLEPHTCTPAYSLVDGDDTLHKAYWSCCNVTVTEKHTGTPEYSIIEGDGTRHNVSWSCCNVTVNEEHTTDSYRVSATNKDYHEISCSLCGALVNSAVHSYNGDDTRVCSVCGLYGICGENLTWELTLNEDGNSYTLNISGRSSMDDYFSNNLPWDSYRDCIKTVVIEEGVTGIGDYAFSYCKNLTGITIPDSVTTIGDAAFHSCESLTGIEIPEGVTGIGDYVFSYCNNLTGITIPDSVTTIGDAAFYSCDSLTGIDIPEGVTSIGDLAFFSCDSLVGVTIPDSVTSIGDSAFSGCQKLTDIDIPANVTTISIEMFQWCSELTGVAIPNSVTTIGNSAFESCKKLTDIMIPDSVTTIGNSAFRFGDRLEVVHYLGTEEQWNAIATEENYLADKTVHYAEIINSTATCSANGTADIYCNTCGEIVYTGVNVVIDPDNHKVDKCIPNDEATHSWFCSLCDAEITTEVHTLNYSANGNVISEECGDCEHTTGTLTITAESGDYNETAQEATVTGTGTLANKTISIEYFKENISLGTSAPTNAGTYTAEITYGEVTASVEYTIAKIDSKIPVAPIPVADLEYNGSAQNLIKPGTVTGGTIMYSLDGEDYSADVPTGTDAKNYIVWYKVIGDENHKDTEPVSLEVVITAKTVEVVSVTVASRDYVAGDATVEVTGIQLSGIVTGNDVAIDLTGVKGTLSSDNAGTYTSVTLPALTLTGADAGNYLLSVPEFAITNVTIEKAPIVADMVQMTLNVVPEPYPTMMLPGTMYVVSDLGYSISISWDPADEKAGYDTVYTAKAYLTATPNYTFAQDISLEDWEVVSNSGAVLVVKRSFEATRKESIMGIESIGSWELAQLCENAADVAAFLPNTILVYTEREPDGVEMPITWSCESYDNSYEAENTFIWNIVPEAYADYDTNGFELSGELLVRNPEPIELFVERLYEYIMNREADEEGLLTWVTYLRAGEMDAATVVEKFVFSDEFVNAEIDDEEYVYILYNAILDREPEEDGFTYWMNKLEGGVTRQEVLAGFTHSTEFDGLCDKYGVTAVFGREVQVSRFVERMYTIVLNRPAEPEGLAYWKAGLLDGSLTGSRMAKGFLYSEEFIGRNTSNEEYIKILYRAFLDREAEAAGLAYWNEKMQQGVSRDEVLGGFIYSVEFSNICAEYGINAGSLE